jgi:hypothetical protein
MLRIRALSDRLSKCFPVSIDMTLWLRLYTDVLDDPKVQRLDGELFKAWINLLCLAKAGDGLLPSIEDIAFKLRSGSEENAKRLTDELVKRGLLDSDGMNLTPHNWHGRQFDSDSSTERVQRYRNVTRNVSETLESRDRTEPDPEPDPEQRAATSRAKPRSVRKPVLPDDEWLDNLQKNPAFSSLNVRLCYHKMLAWCEVNNRQPSRRMFINWLNREDKPMGNGNGKTQTGKTNDAAKDGARKTTEDYGIRPPREI